MRLNEQRFFWALASFSLSHRPLAGHVPSLSLAKDQNSSLPHGYNFFSNALVRKLVNELGKTLKSPVFIGEIDKIGRINGERKKIGGVNGESRETDLTAENSKNAKRLFFQPFTQTVQPAARQANPGRVAESRIREFLPGKRCATGHIVGRAVPPIQGGE
jgi:hypothetical protein